MCPESETTLGLFDDKSVPLFGSDGTSGYLILAIPWVILSIIFFDPYKDFFIWIFLSFLLGTGFQICVYYLKFRRFNNPYTQEELDVLLKSVVTDMEYFKPIQVWLRSSDRSIYSHTSNILFTAILFSESAIHDLLKHPEMAKVVLAETILRISRESVLWNLLKGAIIFTFYSVVEGGIFFIQVLDFDFFITNGFSIIILTAIIFVSMMFILPIVFCYRKDTSEEQIVELYGIPPIAARMQVFGGISSSQAMLDDMLSNESDSDIRNEKRKAMKTAFVISFISLLISLPILYIAYGVSPVLGHLMPILFSIIIAGAVFLIVFVSWPIYKIWKMMRKPRDTTDEFQDSRSIQIEESFRSTAILRGLIVRSDRLPNDEIIINVIDENRDNIIYTISPPILEVLTNTQTLTSFIKTDVERTLFQKKQDRYAKYAVSFLVLFLAISMLYAFLSPTVASFEERFTIFGFAFVAYLMFSGILFSVQYVIKRRGEIEIDMKGCKESPDLTKALKALKDAHITQPFGKTSYSTRLMRIEKKCLESSND